MSFAGIEQFDANLRTLMDSESFKKADDGERLRMGERLLRSKYGLGAFGGFGKVLPVLLREGKFKVRRDHG